MYARVLELGVPNAAAIQGHAFAGGAMLAVAHDFKVMRADRGYWCLPEVDINIPFTPGMTALVQARNLKRSAHEAMTTGRRYGAPEAVEAGLVDEAVPLDEVVARAVERVAPLAKNDPGTLKTIKQRMYAGALARCATATRTASTWTEQRLRRPAAQTRIAAFLAAPSSNRPLFGSRRIHTLSYGYATV